MLAGREDAFREWDAAGEMPASFVQELREFGLFGLIIPEEHGGLAFGNASFADKVKRDQELGFTVVGLRTVTDPYAGQEFFDAVRKAYGGSSGVYGGTIVLLNHRNQMLFGLSQGDVRELPDRLAKL